MPRDTGEGTEVFPPCLLSLSVWAPLLAARWDRGSGDTRAGWGLVRGNGGSGKIRFVTNERIHDSFFWLSAFRSRCCECNRSIVVVVVVVVVFFKV